MATAFTASADFAISKPAGQPCPHLGPAFGCSVHDQLTERGFPGCAAYDCFGAGPLTVQVSFGGRDWRAEPDLAGPMFAAFSVQRQLHELLWYLSEAAALTGQLTGQRTARLGRRLHGELAACLAATEALTAAGPGELTALDTTACREQANVLLARASELARGRYPHQANLRGADLTGADLRQTDLRGANLRGARLIGANLAGTRPVAADFTGTDLRAADLRGADLRQALFLTRAAVAAARLSPATRLPPALAGDRPGPA